MASVTLGANTTAYEPRVGVWDKTSSDVTNNVEGTDTARDIGYVRNNYYRLNLASSLSEKDTEDWYSFNVISQGKLRITLRTAGEEDDESSQSTESTTDAFEQYIKDFEGKNIVFEVYESVGYGRTEIIASNDESNEKLFAKFKELMTGDTKISKTGTYYIRVARKEGASDKDEEPYLLQVQMGDTYKHDYVTTESATDQSAAAQQNALLDKVQATMANSFNQGAALSDMLQIGYNNVAKLHSGKSAKTVADLLA
ncbi:MAG: hypothetical protein IKD08_02915 [Alphaproteobacteria bacterium]|nr:hypothetical protein [Alphaproteobacteria bacterium]